MIADMADAAHDCAIAIIDMPVGLQERQDIPRATDLAARRYLRDRNSDGHTSPGSRVFAAPSRLALGLFRAGRSYHQLNSGLAGPKISQQAYHIAGKISELDCLMTAERQETLREGHPEVAFAALTGRTLPPKKSRAGKAERDSALSELGFDLPALDSGLGRKTGRWARDDLRDACILAWVASRVTVGRHFTLPDLAVHDSRGLRMEISA